MTKLVGSKHCTIYMQYVVRTSYIHTTHTDLIKHRTAHGAACRESRSFRVIHGPILPIATLAALELVCLFNGSTAARIDGRPSLHRRGEGKAEGVHQLDHKYASACVPAINSCLNRRYLSNDGFSLVCTLRWPMCNKQ